MKHVIEPTFTVDLRHRDRRLPKHVRSWATLGFVVGGARGFTYGLTNRFLTRRGRSDGRAGADREFLTVGVQQTYYSNPESSRYDSTYQSTSVTLEPVDLSPVALTARVSPSFALDANSRLEYDVTGLGLVLLSRPADGVNGRPRPRSAVSYSTAKRRRPAISCQASTTMRWSGGTGHRDLCSQLGHRARLHRQPELIASYLAQCCGLQVEFQKFNYPSRRDSRLPSDRRFNFGFVLAGLGTFSNFFGAFGGQR